MMPRPARSPRSWSPAPLVGLAACLAACKGDAPPPPAPPVLEVTVTRVEARDTPVAFELVGKTVSSRRVEVRSRVEGFLEKRVYTEGKFVQEGDILFRMDKKPFEADLQAAEAELAQQVARMDTAKANLDRIKPLVEKKAVSQKDLDDADGSYRTAAAAVEAAQAKVVNAKLNLGYTDIHAPVTGLSSFAVQQEGAYIGYGTDSLLTYVAALDPIWIEFSVSENQVLRVREEKGRGVLATPESDENLEVEVVLADGTVYPHRGQITFADASLSEETGTFMIRADLPNPDHLLRPGQFVRVNILGGYRPNAIVVPQRSVQQGPNGSFVWVIDGESLAQFRPVEVGDWDDQEGWFVFSGLKDGENVVVDGALRLTDGAEVKIVQPESGRDGDDDATSDRGT
jgi:membrane fusion protein (multidrug efflux system)